MKKGIVVVFLTTFTFGMGEIWGAAKKVCVLSADSSSDSSVYLQQPDILFYGNLPFPKNIEGVAYAECRSSRMVGLRKTAYVLCGSCKQARKTRKKDKAPEHLAQDYSRRVARLEEYCDFYWGKTYFYNSLLMHGENYFSDRTKKVLQCMLASAERRFKQKEMAIQTLKTAYKPKKRARAQ